LAAIGFDAEWHCIQAAAVGAPHIRDRVWIVADSSGERIRKLNRSGSSVRFNESDVTFVNGKNVSDSNETDDSVETGKKRTEQEGTRWAESRRVFFAKHLNKYRSDFGARQWGSEPAVGRVANGIPNRAHRLRCLGNAVVPQVAEWIGTQVMEKLR
jgi:DNA (cytosine-5)-methyltransferase 1